MGQKIREARHEARMSADSLAYQVGVTANTVYRWERDEHDITLAKLRLIAAATGKQVAYFLDGKVAA